MKIFQCKKCGSRRISITLGINPNDFRSIRKMCIKLVNEGSLDDDTGWCEKCNDYCEIALVDKDISSIPFEKLYNLWQEEEQEMFIVSIHYYRKSDNESLGGEEYVCYSYNDAKKHIDNYISACDVRPKSETYHVFKLRYIVIPSPERHKLPNIGSLLEDYHFETIDPIFEIKI